MRIRKFVEADSDYADPFTDADRQRWLEEYWLAEDGEPEEDVYSMMRAEVRQ